MTEESHAEEGVVLCAAGADAAVGNRTESMGDPVRLIRLPPCSPNEFTVIKDKETALISLFHQPAQIGRLSLQVPKESKGDCREENWRALSSCIASCIAPEEP